jgi:hypothetical protein
MAIHSIYVTIHTSPKRFREQLVNALTKLKWENIPKSDNYYRLRIINRDVYERLDTIPSDEFTQHGLSEFQAKYHQASGKLISGLSNITNRIGFLKKAVGASEDLIKNFIDKTRDEYFYPDLLILPQEEGVELVLSHKSNEQLSVFIILSYLVLKHEILSANRLRFSGYNYHRKEKKVPPSVSSPQPPPASSPTSPAVVTTETPEALTNFIITLKTQLSENSIKACFQSIEQLYQQESGDQYEALMVLKSEYNRLKQDTIAGIISYENAELKRNQINHRLLLLIDELEEDEVVRKAFMGGSKTS